MSWRMVPDSPRPSPASGLLPSVASGAAAKDACTAERERTISRQPVVLANVGSTLRSVLELLAPPTDRAEKVSLLPA